MRSKNLHGYNLSIPRFVFFLFLASIISCSSNHQQSQQADSSVSETDTNVPVDTALVGKIRWVSVEDEFVLLDSDGKELVRIPQRYFADKPRMINDHVYFYHDKNTDFVMRNVEGEEIRRDGGVIYFPVENSSLHLGISNGEKMGLLDTKGKKVLDIHYEDIRLMHDSSSFWVREEGRYYLVRNGKRCSAFY